MLNKEDQRILEEIVNLSGDCLEQIRCQRCPFRSMCLPDFLNPTPPTKPQRLNMAFDILAHSVLVDSNIDNA